MHPTPIDLPLVREILKLSETSFMCEWVLWKTVSWDHIFYHWLSLTMYTYCTVEVSNSEGFTGSA